MKQEDKELLLKDLCARLPYGLMVQFVTGRIDMLISIDYDGMYCSIGDKCVFRRELLDDVKPYLRPMSSMTEEEKRIYDNFFIYGCSYDTNTYTVVEEIPNIADWLNAHHFDYRGLIERGLALKAPDEMYK